MSHLSSAEPKMVDGYILMCYISAAFDSRDRRCTLSQQQTELVERIGKKNKELAGLIDQFLTDGMTPRPVTETISELETAVRTAVFWFGPSSIELVRHGQKPETPEPWAFVWDVCREGEVTIMENPWAFVLTPSGQLIMKAICESKMPGWIHLAMASMILHAEIDPDRWLPLFRLFATGRYPLTVCSQDRVYDTLQVLVA